MIFSDEKLCTHKPGKTWMNFKLMLLSKNSQSKNATYSIIPFIQYSDKKQNYRARKQISV